MGGWVAGQARRARPSRPRLGPPSSPYRLVREPDAPGPLGHADQRPAGNLDAGHHDPVSPSRPRPAAWKIDAHGQGGFGSRWAATQVSGLGDTMAMLKARVQRSWLLRRGGKDQVRE